MILKRITVLLASGALAGGGAAVAAHSALASDGGSDRPAVNAPAATPQAITRTIPGFGTVMFTVDPTTGAITNVVVTPVSGVTAGTPTVRDGKILIPVTLANGTTATLRVKVEAEEGRVRVEAELENENQVENEPPTTEPAEHEEAPEAEQHQAPEAEHGEGEAPGAVQEPPQPQHEDVPSAPSGSEDGGHSGGSDGGSSHGGND